MTPHPPKSFAESLLAKLAASRFLTVSALLHMLIVLLFGGTVLFNKYVEPPDFSAEGSEFLASGPIDTPPTPEPVQQMPTPDMAPPPPTVTPPAASLTMIATTAPSATGIVVPITAIAPTMSKNISEIAPAPTTPVAKGNTGLSNLPSAMASRGQGRATALQQSGGKQSSEQAVISALRYLQTVQNADGSWGKRFPGAMTGLALLCFLGHGETPAASREFAIVVDKTIKYLLGVGTASQGRFGYGPGGGFNSQPAVYQHGIAAYALGEAYAMTKDEKIEPILAQAINHIIAGQAPDGGWMYTFDKSMPSDTSVSGWQIQALKAAKLAGIKNEKIDPVLDLAIKNLERVYNPKNGSFGYRKAGDRNYSLTGVGILCKLFHSGKVDKMVRDAVKNMESKDVEYDSADADLYAWYYNTQAAFQVQGGAWERWNRRFQDEIVKHQAPNGSWPPTGNAKTHAFMNGEDIDATLFRTTLCTLMLEVYYRYLPTSKQTAEAPPAPSGL
jgi:hypothetical protein